jgi:hypothetical protein
MLQASATNLIAMTLLFGATSAGQAPQNGYQVQNRAAQIEQAAKMRSRSTPSMAPKVQVNDRRRAVQSGSPTAGTPRWGVARKTGNQPDAMAADSGSVTAVSATAP